MGASWNPQPMSDTTGAGYKPMNQSMPISPQTIVQQPMFTQMQPIMVNIK